MPGYLNPRDMPPAVRELTEEMAAATYARFDALFRAPAPTPPAPPPAPRAPHPEITMAQRLAVWHSDPDLARERRAALVVEWGEDEVRVEEEDAILYPYPSTSACDKPRFEK